MKTITLDALGLDVQVPDNIDYSYGGEIPDINQYVLNLLGHKENRRYDGLCLTLYRDDCEKSMHIFVRQGLKPYSKLFLKGHEETHVLERVGRIEVLQRALVNDGYLRKRLEKMPRETRADIGGLYALKRQFSISPSDRKWNEIFNEIDVELETKDSAYPLLSWLFVDCWARRKTSLFSRLKSFLS